MSPQVDLSAYRLVDVPLLCLMDDETVRRLADYVRNGGHLLYTARSGVKDTHNNVVPTIIPPALKEVLGIGIGEAFALKPGQKNRIVTAGGGEYQVSTWIDLVRPEGAEVLARYADDWYRDSAAVTRHRYGKGMAYYIGTIPEGRYLEMELSSILAGAGVAPLLECPRSVWALRRTGSRGDVIFLLNPTDGTETVPLKGRRFRDVLDGAVINGDLELEPYGIRVLTV